jgi:hypothetical protein
MEERDPEDCPSGSRQRRGNACFQAASKGNPAYPNIRHYEEDGRLGEAPTSKQRERA